MFVSTHMYTYQDTLNGVHLNTLLTVSVLCVNKVVVFIGPQWGEINVDREMGELRGRD